MNLELGRKGGILSSLESFAYLAGAAKRFEQTACLFGAGEALRQAIGFPRPSSDRSEYDNNVAACRSQLGEKEFEAAWAQGRAMSMEEAVEYALSQWKNK